jgi:hypothetical protein
MGFCDIVMLDKEYPQYGIARGTVFLSKSLYANEAHFTISADGKLIENLCRYALDTEMQHRLGHPPVYRRFPAGDQIVEYHGDILLYGPARGKDSAELVARFTHGRLEWIRSLDEYPEINYKFLLEQEAR